MIHAWCLFFPSILSLMRATSGCSEIWIRLGYDWRERFGGVFPVLSHLRFKDLLGWRILLLLCSVAPYRDFGSCNYLMVVNPAPPAVDSNS